MNTIHKIIIISILFFWGFSNINAQKNNGIAYVDLGLPSGNLWATNNIGSSGSYVGKRFTWGDTESSSINYWYDNSSSSYNYKYGNQSLTITKYCSNPALGYQGYSDNLSVLQPEDDAATANWGEGWRIPTYEDWMELISNCTIELVIKGNGWDDKWVVTAKNGNSISLPFSKEGYWSSSLNPEVPIVHGASNWITTVLGCIIVCVLVDDKFVLCVRENQMCCMTLTAKFPSHLSRTRWKPYPIHDYGVILFMSLILMAFFPSMRSVISIRLYLPFATRRMFLSWSWLQLIIILMNSLPVWPIIGA